MWLIGKVTWVRAILLVVVQLLGALSAAGLVQVLFSGGLNVSTTLATTTTVAQGFFIEMILTAQLVFTIFMLATEKHAGTFIAPVGIGLALFICELTGVFWTGGSLNPARSLAPSVVSHSFPGYHWIYWIGPGCGAGLAAVLYKLVKSLEYESANPDPEAVAPRPDTALTHTSSHMAAGWSPTSGATETLHEAHDVAGPT